MAKHQPQVQSRERPSLASACAGFNHLSALQRHTQGVELLRLDGRTTHSADSSSIAVEAVITNLACWTIAPYKRCAQWGRSASISEKFLNMRCREALFVNSPTCLCPPSKACLAAISADVYNCSGFSLLLLLGALRVDKYLQADLLETGSGCCQACAYSRTKSCK